MFASLRNVLLAFLPVVGGALASITVALLLFGQVHGMTLAIGSTLIGVAIDYPILVLTHRVLAPDESADQAIDRVWMGALLGGITTAAGFIALAWTSLPGRARDGGRLRAPASSPRWWSPATSCRRCCGRARAARSGWSAAPRWAMRALDWLRDHRRTAAAFVSLTGSPACSACRACSWRDALADINGADPALRAETERVRTLVSRVDEGRLVIASARDEQQALRVNDEVAARLDSARQRASSATSCRCTRSSGPRICRCATGRRSRPFPTWPGGRSPRSTREGFKPEAFAPFRRRPPRCSAPPAVPPLRLADLRASPLDTIVRPFIVQLGDEIGILTFTRDLKDPGRARRDPSRICQACASSTRWSS